MSLFRIILISCALGASSSSMALSKPASHLTQHLSSLPSFQGTFVQSTLKNGRWVEETKGSLSLKRPRYFYYQTDEEVVVSNGKQVWYYYPDIEQAVERAYAQVAKDIPLLIIAGNPKKLTRDYQISEPTSGQFTLSATQSLIQQINIKFNDQGLPVLMELHHSNASLRYRFDFKQNQSLKAQDFQFTPPPRTSILQ